MTRCAELWAHRGRDCWVSTIANTPTLRQHESLLPPSNRSFGAESRLKTSSTRSPLAMEYKSAWRLQFYPSEIQRARYPASAEQSGTFPNASRQSKPFVKAKRDTRLFSKQ